MAMKYNDAVKLYHSMLDRLQDIQEWQKFLSAAATLYKYPIYRSGDDIRTAARCCGGGKFRPLDKNNASFR